MNDNPFDIVECKIIEEPVVEKKQVTVVCKSLADEDIKKFDEECSRRLGMGEKSLGVTEANGNLVHIFETKEYKTKTYIKRITRCEKEREEEEARRRKLVEGMWGNMAKSELFC